MAQKPKTDSLPLKWMAALFVLALLVYGNTLGLGFALDAIAVVKGDPRVHALTAENAGLILRNDYWWPSSVDMLYRPVTTASFLFNYAVLGNGESAAGYHAVNVLLHAANGLLVFLLALRILGKRNAAFFAAALWLVHPITTESVANIAGRADLLAAFFVLSALVLYANPPKKWTAAGFVVCALLATFSKESAAVLVALLLLWDLSFGTAATEELKKRRLVSYGAAAACLALLFAARYWVFSAAPVPEMPYVDNPLRGAGFWAARFTAVKMIGMDLWLLVWPRNLAAERGFNQIPVAGASDAAAWAALALVAAILTVVLVRYRKHRMTFWAAGWFGITLLPVSNLVFLSGATMAERFLYLPSIGFAVAVGILVRRLSLVRPIHWVIAALILCALAGRTMARNLNWQDNLALAQADAPVVPQSARMQEMLASSLFQQDPVRNLDASIQAGERAWAILEPLPPERIFQQTPARLGAYYRLKGDAVPEPEKRAWYDKSLAMLERARAASQAIEHAYDRAQIEHGRPLATRVAYQALYADLGITLMRLGRNDGAVEALRYGREVDPRTPEMYDLLAQAYAGQGQRPMALMVMIEKSLLLGAPADGLGQVTPADLCGAEADLRDLLQKARLPDAARQFEQRASQQGCAQ